MARAPSGSWKVPPCGVWHLTFSVCVAIALLFGLLVTAASDAIARDDQPIFSLWPSLEIEHGEPIKLSFGFRDKECEPQSPNCTALVVSCAAQNPPALVLEYRGLNIGSLLFAAIIRRTATSGQFIRSGRSVVHLGLVSGERMKDEVIGSWLVTWETDSPEKMRSLLRLFRGEEPVQMPFPLYVSAAPPAMLERHAEPSGEDLMKKFAEACSAYLGVGGIDRRMGR
ncbi:hypothetical protein E3C22_14825 [Jiella endophytica]|uniref:Uncharacterized protein n=1 Tax=Jiella endophytica TaxID=2558362 RepID=A0A4Y8RGR0_9HYPH|nr:hypothetical protein [Jiella endophytica]TFF21932.1 hypothetical protein E3C22_14825 [Jiella endophytica]